MRKIIIRRTAIGSLALILAACGGGGGGTTATAGSELGSQSSVTDQFASERQASTASLKQYVTARAPTLHAGFEAAERQIRFDLAGQGLLCGSTHRDDLIAVIESYAGQLAKDSENRAYSIAASQHVDPGAFGKVFDELRASELDYYEGGLDLFACSTGFMADLHSRASAVIGAAHDVALVRLRSAGTVS